MRSELRERDTDKDEKVNFKEFFHGLFDLRETEKLESNIEKMRTGANNDINVLDDSPLFDDLLDDLAHSVLYVVNGVEYRNGYYLADGIYPECASFVKSFTVATDPKHTYFKQRQESARKDVERTFGVFQGRWGLIQQPARAYEVSTLRRIIKQYQSEGAKKKEATMTGRLVKNAYNNGCRRRSTSAKELRDG
nr:hypothetical protein [Tanacetum cinerariifolium]